MRKYVRMQLVRERVYRVLQLNCVIHLLHQDQEQGG